MEAGRGDHEVHATEGEEGRLERQTDIDTWKDLKLSICLKSPTSPHPSSPSRPLMPSAFRLQVKIWFQNKRSKFKKLLKQGGNPHESDPLPGSATLSPRSPGLPPVWDVSASAKGVNMPPNSYMPGYSHWYSSPHQDTMQRPQMM